MTPATVYIDDQIFHVRPNAFSYLFNLRRHRRALKKANTQELWQQLEDLGLAGHTIEFGNPGLISNLKTNAPSPAEGGEEDWFWMDSICIDQTNIPERNHQVSIMEYIYNDAYSVLAFLEPDPAEYFSRLWIVQEVILASRLVFLRRFGCFLPLSCRLDWTAIPDEFFGFIMPETLERIRSSFHLDDASFCTILSLLWDFRKQKCFDKRDRVFGICLDCITIDYEISLEALSADILLIGMGYEEPTSWSGDDNNDDEEEEEEEGAASLDSEGIAWSEKQEDEDGDEVDEGASSWEDDDDDDDESIDPATALKHVLDAFDFPWKEISEFVAWLDLVEERAKARKFHDERKIFLAARFWAEHVSEFERFCTFDEWEERTLLDVLGRLLNDSSRVKSGGYLELWKKWLDQGYDP
jgi:hypothetical protein